MLIRCAVFPGKCYNLWSWPQIFILRGYLRRSCNFAPYGECDACTVSKKVGVGGGFPASSWLIIIPAGKNSTKRPDGDWTIGKIGNIRPFFDFGFRVPGDAVASCTADSQCAEGSVNGPKALGGFPWPVTVASPPKKLRPDVPLHRD